MPLSHARALFDEPLSSTLRQLDAQTHMASWGAPPGQGQRFRFRPRRE